MGWRRGVREIVRVQLKEICSLRYADMGDGKIATQVILESYSNLIIIS